MNFSKLLVFVGVFGFTVSVAQADAPKYGPNAVPLSMKSNQAYFKKNDATDFWSLIPYYVPQSNSRQCSTANFVMILNAARTTQNLKASDPLITSATFLEKIADSKYSKAMSGKGMNFDRSIVAVKNLGKTLDTAARNLRIKGAKAELVEIDLKDLEKSKKAFKKALIENEANAKDFVAINFLQGVLTGDPEGGGHVATIGAYDASKDLVLVLDPDREWYEPYWSPFEKVFAAVADPKSDGQHPGWIWFKFD